MGRAISRRRFGLGSAGVAAGIAIVRSPARSAAFQFKQYHNQTADSPLHRRLTALWSAVEAETGGRFAVQTFAENNHHPGSDPAVFKLLIAGEIEFYTLMGGLISAVVPAADIQGMPFAFKDRTRLFATLDGALGDYLQREMLAKGIYALPKACFENGFRHITTNDRPIRRVDDVQGLKIRTPDGRMFIELFQALGAEPKAINVNQIYSALRAGIVEAQENPLAVAEVFRLYEIQKQVGLTGHMWSGFNLLANAAIWQRIPADIQAVIERNAAAFAALQRQDQGAFNDGLRTKLAQQGMVFTEVDVASFRARLGPFYARWKTEIGRTAWDLLEAQVGKLA